MKSLISIDDFIKLTKSDEKYIIFDCRFDLHDKTYGRKSYLSGHIVGAHFIDVEHDLTESISENGHGGRHPYKNPRTLQTLLQIHGITNDTTIIVYDDGEMQGAGRLVFQLRSIGHKKVYALDGGLTVYKSKNLPIETTINLPSYKLYTDNNYEFSKHCPMFKKGHNVFDCNKDDQEDGNFSINDLRETNSVESKYIIDTDNDMFVDMNYVKSKLYDENTVIVDSRSHNRYKGEIEPIDKVAGHIPSAKSYFYEDALDIKKLLDGANTSFKNIDVLNEHFKNLRDKNEVIIYCGSGISLNVNALALEMCGIDFKIYPGSYSDWISYDENDIKTGDE